MDNQHKHIKGYRDLSEDEIKLINVLKEMEAGVADALHAIEADARLKSDMGAGRWAAIARTHLETGFMFAIKAVARPTNGLGRKDPE